MRPKYCLPIIKNSQSAVVEALNAGRRDYDYFEVWLDYVADWDERFVTLLVDDLGERLILLFRRQNLEPITTRLERRASVVRLLNGRPCLLDIDVGTQKEDLDYLVNHDVQVKTIISYHNYQRTPDDDRLAEIIHGMREYKPDVFKIATRCQGEEDAVRLLRLLLELKRAGEKCIVLGMGAPGLVTRVFGTLWGNEMVFAPREIADQSAPGQLTQAQLAAVFRAMGA